MTSVMPPAAEVIVVGLPQLMSGFQLVVFRE